MRIHGDPTIDFFEHREKVVTINLNDSQSIRDAINKFINSKNDIIKATEEAITILCKEGEEYAKYQAPYDADFGTDHLREHITSNVVTEGKKVTGTITAAGDHALFVEFGTGVVGAMLPHPATDVGWEYDVNGHGYKGWTYPKGNGRFFHTLGQPSNPFMYRTAKYLSENAERILNEGIHSGDF